MVKSKSVLPLRAMTGSNGLLQPWSVLMSVALVTAKGHEDIHDLCCHLKLY